MNWAAFGAVGEIVGAGAVVVTLLVLITQLRQNTAEMRAATVQSLLESSTELFTQTISSPIPEIIGKQQKGETLTGADEYRLFMFHRRNFQLFEQVYLQYLQKRVSQEVMDAYRQRILSHVSNARWEEYWAAIKPLATRSFVIYVEQVSNDV
ncbi:MAG: hypothetical protein O3A63_04310 [Proteobacteria bacterium]|nr:hypothetical protein [Pseudomonadota bacterium]